MPDNINLLAAQADMDAKDAALANITQQLNNALHDLDVATDQVGTLTDDVRDATRRANVAEDNAASLAEQLKTARAGAALVPGLQAWVKELTDRIAELTKAEPEPARFPGDPGVGKYRVGWSLERGTASGWDLAEVMAQPWWNDAVTIIHDYARSTAKFLDRVSAQATIDAGFPIVSMSCKLTGMGSSPTARFDAVTSGAQNAAIDSDAEWMKAHPDTVFWVTIYHEPEDLTVAVAAKLRAATRYIALRLRAAGVTNVAFAPIYQVPWTFRAGADFRVWHPDWKGTTTTGNPAADWFTGDDAVCALFGGDVYDPLPPKSPAVTGNHRTFANMWDATLAATDKAGMPRRPIHQGEFGMGRINTPNQAPPEGWPKYGADSKVYAEENDFASFCYWDNSDDIGRYRLTDAGKREAWDLLCAGAVR